MDSNVLSDSCTAGDSDSNSLSRGFLLSYEMKVSDTTFKSIYLSESKPASISIVLSDSCGAEYMDSNVLSDSCTAGDSDSNSLSDAFVSHYEIRVSGVNDDSLAFALSESVIASPPFATSESYVLSYGVVASNAVSDSDLFSSASGEDRSVLSLSAQMIQSKATTSSQGLECSRLAAVSAPISDSVRFSHSYVKAAQISIVFSSSEDATDSNLIMDSDQSTISTELQLSTAFVASRSLRLSGSIPISHIFTSSHGYGFSRADAESSRLAKSEKQRKSSQFQESTAMTTSKVFSESVDIKVSSLIMESLLLNSSGELKSSAGEKGNSLNMLSESYVLSEMVSSSRCCSFSDPVVATASIEQSAGFPSSELQSKSICLDESNCSFGSGIARDSGVVDGSSSQDVSGPHVLSSGLAFSRSYDDSSTFASSSRIVMSELLPSSRSYCTSEQVVASMLISDSAGFSDSATKLESRHLDTSNRGTISMVLSDSEDVKKSDWVGVPSRLVSSSKLRVSDPIHSGSHLISDSDSIVVSSVATWSIEVKSSSSIDSSLSFSLSKRIILSELFVNSGRHRISSLVYVTGASDDSVQFRESELGWKSPAFGGWSFLPISVVRLNSDCREYSNSINESRLLVSGLFRPSSALFATSALSKSQDLVLSNFAVKSIVFSHSHRPLSSEVISKSSSRWGSDSLSGSAILAVSDGLSVSDRDAESTRFSLSARFDGSDVLVVTKISMNSMNCCLSNVTAESSSPEHTHHFSLSESISVSGCISNLNLLVISIALQGSRQVVGSNPIVDSVNVTSPQFQFSSLDRGTVSLLLSDSLISEGHRLSKAGFEFGHRPSESVLASCRLGRSNQLSPSGFALVSGTRPIVQQSGRFGFSRSISVSGLISPSALVVVSRILDRNSLSHYVSNEAESTVFMESRRLGHSDLTSRLSYFGSIIRADSALVNLISRMKSLSSYRHGSFPFVVSDVLKATLSFLSTRSDRPDAESSGHSVSRALVTSASGGAAATVSFGGSCWNSISDSVTVSSTLSESGGAQGSQRASTLGMILGIFGAILFLLLLVACCIICFVWKRRRTTDQSELSVSPNGIPFDTNEFQMDEMFGFYENPESSPADSFADFIDESYQAKVSPE
jgi:epidermal growth factor receptor substrate 15